ncbi:MAG: indolepyruvate ferredoxin oxidoreductase family protein [Rhodospirillales bacterium]|nr:indolepyruvate ferredoxin oxidoreductase [Rhodospirillaceae bacterium]MDP6427207.1 indolepyruvate ferredoxin oxidoreductase family protein [Rhodospirillales bacterium]MDP6645403.1 indolepyruvate ferredoxin oxidoreductase family protein [Rhodospirillales bacterium]MDP6841329.1 indolepyruvate ferredoxin oxidoreductase family protein [Rhodospirillales bacterium]
MPDTADQPGAAALTLDTKFTASSGRIYITGAQALARLPLMQRQMDQALGLNTAGYISGYRGSPLGGYDIALWRAAAHLDEHHIKFQPGVNEDMAATACWGTQQTGMTEAAKYDGVFAIWYGKGPGVDRSGDAFKHGNYAGTAPNGGVLVLTGDDHGAVSSTTAHQSEQALVAAMIPVLYPASVQEFIDYGLYGFAMSRFSGAWAAMKCVNDIIESGASIGIDPDRVKPVLPEDFRFPEDGVHIRWPDAPKAQEARMIKVKLKAAQAFVRENGLDRETHAAPMKRLGIVAAGKAWLDVCQAFEELGLSDAMRAGLGISVFKLAMTWPMEPSRIGAWAAGFDEILVIEEKRNLIEDQLARALYRLDGPERPRLLGKTDEAGEPLVPEHGELSGSIVAQIIANRFLDDNGENCLGAAAARIAARTQASNLPAAPPERTPWFCAGCPHNTSTRLPEGSRALSGIGCHTLAIFMDRGAGAYTHMGGEGGTWIGQAPFTSAKHVFQNIGDGTYYHSGLMAIRAAVAAGVNITYKILYNDAVALTGGQPLDGSLMPWDITHQLWAEGVKRIAVVTDEPGKYSGAVTWAPGAKIHHRRELERLQIELRDVPGVTAIVYDQTCAAEKRRRRKRGRFPDPPRRIFINEDVCEGCGDCSTVSNCVAILPAETPLGRKREVDQSSCNKDYSCAEGFCPSFVSVHGGELRRMDTKAEFDGDPAAGLADPEAAAVAGNFSILLTGIGGTGVITSAALLGTAAHLDGLGCSVLDQTGVSQKNGAVMSHVRLSQDPDSNLGTRIGTGGADLIVGFDMVVAAGSEAITAMDGERSRAVINDHMVPLAAFAENPDMDLNRDGYTNVIQAKLGRDRVDFVNATHMATRLLGDTITANIFVLGFAYQKGLLPISQASIAAAIRLNDVAVEDNLRSFAWGRVAAADPARIAELTGSGDQDRPPAETSLSAFIAANGRDLAAYQNRGYAARYLERMDRLLGREKEAAPGRQELGRAAARNLYRLMAYKDEYEVARLYTDGRFRQSLETRFTGKYRLGYHLAPPLLAPRDRVSGAPRKLQFGAWMGGAFKVLARLKFLRATPFDPFGYLAERRRERRLRGTFETLVEEITAGLTSDNYDAALALIANYDQVRGYGHVKRAAMDDAERDAEALRAAFRNGDDARQAAE